MSMTSMKCLIVAGGIGISGIGGWQAYENLRPIPILERLSDKSFYPLDAGGENDGWKQVAKRYQGDNTSNKLNGVTIATSEPNNVEVESLIRECNRLLGLNTRWEERKDEIEKVNKWCTTDGK